MRTAALLSLLARWTAAQSFPAIGSYQPKNDVTGWSRLSQDLRAMDDLLTNDESEQGFAEARRLYEQGAFADPYATLQVEFGIPYDLTEGTLLQGTDTDGQAVDVTVIFGNYTAGATELKVAFRHSDCWFAGAPAPVLNGCLETSGALVLPGQPKELRYAYNLRDDIATRHTLQGLSVHAHSKYKPHGHGNDYFGDFEKHVQFFGTPDFADQIVQAAFGRSHYTGGPHNEWVLDFKQFSPRARRSIIVHAIAYLSVGQFVIRQLETALVECDHGCALHHELYDDSTDGHDCNHASIHALDGAVALYTGSVFAETGAGGNFLYGLADKMCSAFRTCGLGASSTTGTAQVNEWIMQGFSEMQQNFDKGHCLEAKQVKERIAHWYYVPLFQATLLSLHLNVEDDTLDNRAERVLFATATRPLVYHCDASAATADLFNGVSDALEPPQHHDFDNVKRVLQAHYDCLRVTCQSMGGLWDPLEADYVPGAASCFVPQALPDGSSSEPLMSKHMLVLYIVALTAVGLVGYCLLKRHIRGQQRLHRRGHGGDDDSSDSSDSDDDDFSVGSHPRSIT